MLSTTARRLASGAVRNVRKSLRDPSASYDFIPAETRDKGAIMDITLNHFFTIEPHSRALGINAENGREFIDWIVSKSLKYPHSYRIVHKESGKLIGIRLMSEWARGSTDDSEDIDVTNLGENVLILASIIDNLKKEFWQLRPEAKKVLRREITFVHNDHQRQGIAQHLVHLGLDFDRLRASSIANQTLLAKNGYEELARSERKDYTRSNGEPIVFPDATTALKLFYLNLNQTPRP